MANKVFLNLKESTFIILEGKLKFYFSSEFNKNRFLEQKKNYINDEMRKIEIKNNMPITEVEGLDEKLIDYLLISLYNKIEKRGFLVE